MNIKIIRFTAFLTVVACVFLLAAPAMALSRDLNILDFDDYVSSTVVDGVNKTVTLTVPASQNMWIQSELGGYALRGYYDFQAGSDATFYHTDNEDNSVISYPLGYTESEYVPGAFTAENFPNGTNVRYTIYLYHDSSGSYTYPPQRFNAQIRYRDSEGEVISRQNVEFTAPSDNGTARYDIDFVVDKPTGTEYFEFFMWSDVWSKGEGSDWLIVRTTDVSFTIGLNLLVEQQQLTQQTNEILTQVEKQLESQGKTLDQILTGTPAQNQAASNASGQLAGQKDKIESLLPSMTPAKPDLSGVNTDVNTLVPSGGVSVLTQSISPIMENDLVMQVLIMVGTLLLVSYVLFGKKG